MTPMTPLTAPELDQLDFSQLSRAQLLAMQQAADDMMGVLQEAAEQGIHILTDVLASSDEAFTQWQHYPPGDVKDKKAGAIWFYHAHAEDEVARPWDEHGHFHTFIYTEHFDGADAAIALPEKIDEKKGGLTHLVAISFNKEGLPMKVFTTNRWVTDEWMYSAEETIERLDKFKIETGAHRLTSRWLVAALQLFRPQIEWSLRHRDQFIEQLKAADDKPFDADQDHEVLSAFSFDLMAQIDSIEEALGSG